MVKVREDYPQTSDGRVDIDAWIARIAAQVELYDPAELRAACELARELDDKVAREDVWSARTSSFLTGLAMADILAELQLDQESLIAAVLYRSVREGKITLDEIRETFSEDISTLIDGVLRMAVISQMMNPGRQTVFGQQQEHLDNLRKMLVALIDDVRVALIKLAERTFAIRELKEASNERKQRVAREIFDIYAPLAHRLGIGQIKWELEDLSFRYLEPEAYKQIATLLDEKRVARDQYISNVVKTLREKLAEAGIDGDIKGRAKHIYSIWRKMKRKHIAFSEVYDVRALRILVSSLSECYAALGIVHSLWKHIPREFDDYIATPKENGYRSLHTAVIGPEGKPLEVQIRTREMHDEAELGVCAHWRYKEGGRDKGQKSGIENKIAWLRQVLEWQDDMGDVQADGLAEQINHSLIDDRIYVFTPEGHVVDLPGNATALDFAYTIHTEVGNACRGAKVNGRIVPLTYLLNTGEQVEILTQKGGRPSRDWLQQSLGYLNTPRARAKVQRWFRLQDRDENIRIGKELLEHERHRLALAQIDLNAMAPRLNLRGSEDIYAALGAGDVRMAQILALLPDHVDEAPRQEELLQDLVRASKAKKESGVLIEGVGNLLTQLAGCCKPMPGEPIVGYVSHGRGVIIHAADCHNLATLIDEEPGRLLDASWSEGEASTVYPVDIHILAWDRQGLLRDITSVLANEHVNVTAVQTQSDHQDGTASMTLTVEVESLSRLSRVLARVEQLRNVISTRRVRAS